MKGLFVLLLTAVSASNKYIVVLEDLALPNSREHFVQVNDIINNFGGTTPKRVHRFNDFYAYTINDLPDPSRALISDLPGVKYIEKDKTGSVELPVDGKITMQTNSPSWG